MKKYLFFLITIVLSSNIKSYAQFTRYIVQLKNKSGTPYSINNPIQFLTQRSIDRRARYSIPIDSTDLPIPPAYIDSILSVGNVTLLNVSKWLNQVCIKTSDSVALAKINSFSFVISTPPIAARPENIYQPAISPSSTNILSSPDGNVAARPEGIQDYYNYGEAYPQINLHEGEFLHNHGFRGEGMIMAVTDEGFINYNTLSTFDSIRNNNQVLGTWNYVAGDSDVSEGIGHGIACLGTIAANLPGVLVGTAPQTSFYLFVTEDVSSEYPVEEQNWAAAAEKSDSLGVDVISVSLGYSTFDSSQFNYTYNDMNGHTTLIAKAANFAAAKGMIVVAAMGNDGNDAWHYLLTPADADSVLTVGAVDTAGQVASFSSYGPNSSGQTKPDVAAVGENAYVADQVTGQPIINNGTSFACPTMAGLTTCLWEAFPEERNMDIIGTLHQASNRATNPDDRTGYGIPDMKKAFVLLIQKLHTFQSTISGSDVILNWSAKSAADMNFVIERKFSSDLSYQPIDTQSANSSFQTNSFTYTDDLSVLSTFTGVNYRIKMIIGTDTSFYLDSIAIPPPPEKIVVGPNPVSDDLSVTVTRNEASGINIEVYSISGQKLYTTVNQQGPGNETYLIPFGKMSSGVYFVNVFINNKKEMTYKIVRQ